VADITSLQNVGFAPKPDTLIDDCQIRDTPVCAKLGSQLIYASLRRRIFPRQSISAL